MRETRINDRDELKREGDKSMGEVEDVDDPIREGVLQRGEKRDSRLEKQLS